MTPTQKVKWALLLVALFLVSGFSCFAWFFPIQAVLVGAVLVFSIWCAQKDARVEATRVQQRLTEARELLARLPCPKCGAVVGSDPAREHFAVLGIEKRPFAVASRWFSGKCSVPTYPLDEMLGTKLRALYQRSKGRDLFDIWHGITAGKARPAGIADTFQKYMKADGHAVSKKEFRKNLSLKLKDARFLGDTADLLHPSVTYDPRQAHGLVDQEIIALL